MLSKSQVAALGQRHPAGSKSVARWFGLKAGFMIQAAESGHRFKEITKMNVP